MIQYDKMSFLVFLWIKSFSSVQFNQSVMSNSLWPHESQHVRPPCPSPTPGVHSDSRPSSPWCHPAISSSVVPSPPAPNPVFFSFWLHCVACGILDQGLTLGPPQWKVQRPNHWTTRLAFLYLPIWEILFTASVSWQCWCPLGRIRTFEQPNWKRITGF